MGGCQKYGPFLGPYYNTAPNIQGTQRGTIILTTTHMFLVGYKLACSLLGKIACPVKNKTLNPKPLNPKPLNPKPLNPLNPKHQTPKPSKPKTQNPYTLQTPNPKPLKPQTLPLNPKPLRPGIQGQAGPHANAWEGRF